MFEFITNDRYQPYTLAILLTILLILQVQYWQPSLPPQQNVASLANIFITVVSIFVGFLGVGLTLIYQGRNENDNLKMLRANGKYDLLIAYFKQAILCSVLSIGVGVFASLGIMNNWSMLITLLGVNMLVFSLNFRIIHFLFKVLEN